jgi:prophage regulatory protein
VCEDPHGGTPRSHRQKDRPTTPQYQALKERGIPWSRVHIARLEAARKFPLHIDVGENSIAWFEDEIDDYLEMKAAERDAKAAARAKVQA